jgi:hypothetical protein
MSHFGVLSCLSHILAATPIRTSMIAPLEFSRTPFHVSSPHVPVTPGIAWRVVRDMSLVLAASTLLGPVHKSAVRPLPPLLAVFSTLGVKRSAPVPPCPLTRACFGRDRT